MGKNISNLLEELFFFEKIEFQNIILQLPKTYANSFAKEIPIKGFISNKVAMLKACLN
jgi:hypothetical protein